MNKLPNEIIRQIRKFDSHPVADLFETKLELNIRCYCEDLETSRQYELKVIGNRIRTLLNVESIKKPFLRQIAIFDVIYFHINRSQMEEIVILDSCKRHGVANMDDVQWDWMLYV